jgi:RNA polymerase sigma-70 factor (ECF subfamily)
MGTAHRFARTAHRVTEPASAPPPEHELVVRAQRGDVAAFEALYHASSGRVFALCLRMAGDRARATELLQDVFVRVWERLGSFRGEAAFGTWVHRLAVNVVLENRRRDERRAAGESGAAEEACELDGLTVERTMDLETAVSRLPAGARRAFVLHDIEGYKHHEIAKMTGLAEGTLRAQLHRARQLLMEMLT